MVGVSIGHTLAGTGRHTACFRNVACRVGSQAIPRFLVWAACDSLRSSPLRVTPEHHVLDLKVPYCSIVHASRDAAATFQVPASGIQIPLPPTRAHFVSLD